MPIAVLAIIVLLERLGDGCGPIDAALCEPGMLTGAVTRVRDGDTVEVELAPVGWTAR